MKKNNLILLIVIVILGLIVALIYFSRVKETRNVYRDFAVDDTASINKIFLADKNNNTILLERKENHWLVNNDHKARRDLVDVLLTTIKRLEVSSPVPDAKLAKVLKDLSVTGIKAEIYQNDKLVKTYYVGGVTEDNTGTYMILEGSDIPFVLHIPGFAGYLTVRYVTELNEWRERQIFNYKIQDIAKIYVEFPNEPESSFIVHRYDENNYDLTEIDGSPVDFIFDTVYVKEYVSRCKFIGFEAYIMDELQEHKRDSLLKEPMVAKYTVEDSKSNKNSLRVYYRQNINKFVDDDGNLYEWDIDRLYGIINNDTDAVLLQYFVIDPITLRKRDFELKN